MAARVESRTNNYKLAQEKVNDGRMWLLQLTAKLAIEDMQGAVARKADDAQIHCIEPGVNVEFVPHCLIRREVKSPVINKGDDQEPTIVMSDSPMRVGSFGVYRDEEGQGRAVFRSFPNRRGEYLEIHPLLDPMNKLGQVGVTGAFPVEQAA